MVLPAAVNSSCVLAAVGKYYSLQTCVLERTPAEGGASASRLAHQSLLFWHMACANAFNAAPTHSAVVRFTI